MLKDGVKLDEGLKECLWELIYIIAEDLESSEIPYCFDDATALFVHGIDFNMDFIDVTVQWDHFEITHKLFKKYGASPIRMIDKPEFYFIISGLWVHVAASDRVSYLANASDRIQVIKDCYYLWSRSVDSYRNNITPDHPHANIIDSFLKAKGK